MIAPARMNSGIAISGKLVAPLYSTMGRLGSVSAPWDTTIATTATMPSDTAIGTSISMSARTQPKRTRIVHQCARRRPVRRAASARTFGSVRSLRERRSARR